MERKKEKDTKKDWSKMPVEILELFCKRLTISDQVMFGSVCKMWYSSASNKAYLWVPDTPWLIDNEDTSSQFRLYSSTVKRNFEIPKPFKPFEDSFIAASTKGWLFIRSDSNIFMLNIFSNVRIDLPPQTTMPDILKLNSAEEGMMDTTHLGFTISTCPNLNPIHVEGVTFSGDLTWCKIGDKAWKGYKDDYEYGNLTFQNHKLYAIDGDGTRIDVFKLVNDDDDESSTVLLLVDNIHVPTDETPMSDTLDLYLVESKGSLLVVKRYYDNSRLVGTTIGFHVFKVVEEEEEINRDTSRLIKVDSLDGQALFLSDLSSESHPGKNCSGLRGDCIYYLGHTNNGFRSEMGVFAIKEKCLLTMTLKDLTGINFPIWVLPRFTFAYHCKLHDSTFLKPQKHGINYRMQQETHILSLARDVELLYSLARDSFS